MLKKIVKNSKKIGKKMLKNCSKKIVLKKLIKNI